MDIHQKKAAIVFAVASILAYSLILYLFRISWEGALILALCGILFIILFLRINSWIRPYLNSKEYPNNDWYRTHLDRNFDILILGDELSRNKIPEDILRNKKVFDCSLSDQNLYTDFLVLKNSFSILKPQGTVYLPLRKASIRYIEDKFVDERRYYWALSPYVFNTSRISCIMKKIYTRIPGLLFRFKDCLYLFKKMFDSKQDELKQIKTIELENLWLKTTPEHIKKDLLVKQQNMIEEMRQFCVKRDIQLVIIDTE